MKTPLLTVMTLLLLVSIGVSQQKPWAEWTREEADKILNHSAWGQTQTETDTSEMVYTPTTLGGATTPTGSTRSENVRGITDRQSVNNSRVAQGATNQAISVNYHIRLLSAKPVRQAFFRFMELTRKDLDRETLKGLRSFVERDFSDYIAVAVTFDSTDGRYSGPALQAFGSATLGTLKNRTYLERKDGKRLFLMDYYSPINDGLGAKLPGGHEHDAPVAAAQVEHRFPGLQLAELQHLLDHQFGSRIVGRKDIRILRCFLPRQDGSNCDGDQMRHKAPLQTLLVSKSKCLIPR